MVDDDRLSQLPQHILQNHILSLLPQIVAVRTCVLSKSWRHLGLTRPKFEYEKHNFPGTKQEFLSVVERTLKRYDDQKLSIQEFVLGVSVYNDSESISLLNKWIPKVVTSMGVKIFNLKAFTFSLPSVVFQAELLEELVLHGCKLPGRMQVGIINVKLHMLKRLQLQRVLIEEETFEKIMSSCPLIQHLVLKCCKGLSNVKVNKAHNLKHFDCHIFGENDSIEIDDAPSLETIRIEDCENWHNHNNYFFPRLKSLYLCGVHVPTELLNNLSSDNCPCLEELQLHGCSGFTEFELSSRSIKRLIIDNCGSHDRPIKADIDAANILYFELRSYYLPSILSFATTSRECKSCVEVGCYSDSTPDVLSTWPLKLHEFLKALSQSQISLDISYPFMYQGTLDGDSCERVVVEHLCMRACSSSADLTLLNSLFRICRPRSWPSFLFSHKLAESTWETLEKKGEASECDFWQQDLEESNIQVFDENTNEWHSVQECAFPKIEIIRFRLKWRNLSYTEC